MSFFEKFEILNFQKFKFQKISVFFGAYATRRQAPLAPSMAPKCCSMAPNRKLVARAQRGSRALTRRGVHICVRSPGGGRRPLNIYIWGKKISRVPIWALNGTLDHIFAWCAPQGENFATKPRLSKQLTELRRLPPLWWHFDARNNFIFDQTSTQNGLFVPYIGLW